MHEPNQEPNQEPKKDNKRVAKKIGKNKYRPYRKIFATVKSEVFNKFKERCEKEGMDDIGNALSVIVEEYANGATISFKDERK